MPCAHILLFCYSECTYQYPVMIQIYERVQVTEDGRTGTVLESDVLGVVVQYDGTDEQEWLYYEQVEQLEFDEYE